MRVRYFFRLFILLVSVSLYGQNTNITNLLTPSDTLNTARKKVVTGVTVATLGLSSVGLYGLWYKNYPQSSFHTIDDTGEWEQMDKLGHFFSSYHLGRVGTESLAWAGVSERNQLIYGSTLGLAYLTTIEVMDGFSSEWGFSWGDMLANASGTLLCATQLYVWKEQRIIPKFSFHTTSYAGYRPDVLGKNFNEQVLKDYNGQTYWLSVNLASFVGKKIPSWFNVAIGYGADGMVSGYGVSEGFERKKQWYASIDVDFTRIKTRVPILKTLFSVINTLKVPAPTIEFGKNRFRYHWLYF